MIVGIKALDQRIEGRKGTDWVLGSQGYKEEPGPGYPERADVCKADPPALFRKGWRVLMRQAGGIPRPRLPGDLSRRRGWGKDVSSAGTHLDRDSERAPGGVLSLAP